MSFRTRYHAALAFKDLDIEESIDRRFHRPLAAALTAVLLSTPITPNQVTVSSLAAGWAGSFCLYQAFFGDLFSQTFVGATQANTLLFVLAGFFLFASVILDCADGQLARARGGGSRVGRILDGVVDALVLLPAYVLIGLGILDNFGALWFGIAAFAGVSTWARTMVYDNIKIRFQAQTTTGADASSGVETREDVLNDLDQARESGSMLERLLLRIYLLFMTVKARLASDDSDAAPVVRSAEQTATYRREHRATMRLAAAMGLGTHMLLIYTSVAAAAISLHALLIAQALLAFVFTPLLIVVLVRARNL